MKYKLVIIIFLIATVLLAACGNQSANPIAEDYSPANGAAEQDEPLGETEYYVPKEYDEPGTEPYETPEEEFQIPIDTDYIAIEVVLNDYMTFILEGYVSDGRSYLLLEDIAYMLYNTQAHFGFYNCNWFSGAVRINRGESYTESLTIETFGQSATTVVASMQQDTLTGSYSTFTNARGIYFAIEDLAGFLGFSINSAPDGTILIDTHEPHISEYGRMAAQEFLSTKLTLFTHEWDEEILAATPGICLSEFGYTSHPSYVYPVGFRLHDFSNNGMPDILMLYDAEPWAMLRRFVLYVYAGGGYTRAGSFSMWGEFYRDTQGRVLSIEGGHHDGF
ncbi:MAG: hypothetical protein FWE42_09620, partial [Defluviitaleaceae bacterium]|nr:hypothetical protein [Defluviitaleaceae bacterium]